MEKNADNKKSKRKKNEKCGWQKKKYLKKQTNKQTNKGKKSVTWLDPSLTYRT